MSKKFLLALWGLSLVGCAYTGTPYIKAPKLGEKGYFVKESAKNPGHGVSVFFGNKHTDPATAYAYTVLAAHEWCLNQGKVSLVLPPQNFTETKSGTEFKKFASSFQCDNRIKNIKNLPLVTEDIAKGILIRDESPGKPFKSQDIISGLKLTELFHKVNNSEKNSLRIKIIRSGKPRTLKLALIDKTDYWLKTRNKDILRYCNKINGEKPGICGKK